MDNLELPCFIFEKSIQNKENLYSCTLCQEYLDSDSYSVTDVELAMSVCEDCYRLFHVDRRIDAELFTRLSVMPKGKKDAVNVVPIHNQYACDKCQRQTRDGDTISSVTHSLESIQGNEIEPEDSNFTLLICEACSISTEIKITLRKVVDAVTVECRKELIRRSN